jgi:hypothetical protein
MITPQVTKLPYIPPDEKSGLHFDRCIYDSLRTRMVSAKSQLTFTDIGTMHAERRAVKNGFYIPTFAGNDSKLRLVLAQQAWSFVKQGNSRVPADLVHDFRKLEAMCMAKVASDRTRLEKMSFYDPQYVTLGQNIGLTEKFGYLRLRARVAYLCWRLGWDSCIVAEQCGITPMHVRNILNRLCFTATRLGLETHAPHRTAGKPKASRSYLICAPVVYLGKRLRG